MIESLIVYIGIVVVMSFFFSLSAKYDRHGNRGSKIKSHILFMFAIVVFAAVFGMRYYVGIDYHDYYETYIEEKIGLLRYEPGFAAITYFCINNDYHYAVYFSLLAFIQGFFSFGALHSYKQILPFYTLVAVFSGLVMTGWMNGIRQSIAEAIFFFSLSFLCKRSIVSILVFYVLLLLAVSMHYSALFYIFTPLYLFFKRGIFNNKNLQILLLFSFFILQLFNIKSFFISYLEPLLNLTRYAGDYGYVLEGTTNSTYGIFDFLNLLIYVVIIWNSDKIKVYFKNDHFFILIYDFGILGIYLNYLFGGSMMLLRSVQYLTSCIYPLMAFYMFYFYKCRKNDLLRRNYYIFVVYFLLAFSRILLYLDNNNSRYVFFFQKELRYQKEQERYNSIRDID